MKNCEKNELRRLVLLGLSIKRIEGMGFKRATIKKYYKALKDDIVRRVLTKEVVKRMKGNK